MCFALRDYRSSFIRDLNSLPSVIVRKWLQTKFSTRRYPVCSRDRWSDMFLSLLWDRSRNVSGSMSSKLFHKMLRNLRNVVFWKSPRWSSFMWWRERCKSSAVFGRSLGTEQSFSGWAVHRHSAGVPSTWLPTRGWSSKASVSLDGSKKINISYIHPVASLLGAPGENKYSLIKQPCHTSEEGI